ncbi:uncharacterized protein LOC144288580 [Canis aureus]
MRARKGASQQDSYGGRISTLIPIQNVNKHKHGASTAHENLLFTDNLWSWSLVTTRSTLQQNRVNQRGGGRMESLLCKRANKIKKSHRKMVFKKERIKGCKEGKRQRF